MITLINTCACVGCYCPNLIYMITLINTCACVGCYCPNLIYMNIIRVIVWDLLS